MSLPPVLALVALPPLIIPLAWPRWCWAINSQSPYLSPLESVLWHQVRTKGVFALLLAWWSMWWLGLAAAIEATMWWASNSAASYWSTTLGFWVMVWFCWLQGGYIRRKAHERQ